MNIVVLISGRGSNLQSIIDMKEQGGLDATIAAVISNVADAPGLQRADKAGIKTHVINHEEFANRQAFENIYLRPMRMVDTSSVNLETTLLGEQLQSPIVLAPVGSQKAFPVAGELGSARAAKSRDHLQCLSTVSSTSIEDVVQARGEPLWFQLYTGGGWQGVRARLRRAEAAGCPAVALTVDNVGGTPRRTLARATQADTRDCTACHEGSGPAARPKPMTTGGDNSGQVARTWEFVDRLLDETTMKVLLKGIVTAEDAIMAIDSGVCDG